MGGDGEGKPYEPSLGDFLQEMWAYENTQYRARVLIDVAKIDNHMERLLFRLVKAPLTKGEYRSLFGTDAPLGTTSARREALYAFGLIDRRTSHAIRCLTHIRNAFAHNAQVADMNHNLLQGSLTELRKLLSDGGRAELSKITDLSEKREAIYRKSVHWVTMSFLPHLLTALERPQEDAAEPSLENPA